MTTQTVKKGEIIKIARQKINGCERTEIEHLKRLMLSSPMELEKAISVHQQQRTIYEWKNL